VSFDADPLTGFAIYDTAGNLIEVGGTSASAPAWAAVYAIQLQHDASAGISPAFAGPRLYGLGGPLAPAAGMHDVVQGSNLSYPATVGWDLATGLGSPDVARLLARLAG
jgi:kumamolisin